MKHPVVIRVAKLSTWGAIAGSGKHTWREMEVPNADRERTPDNEDWRAVRSANELREAVSQRLEKVTEKFTTKNPVRCIEYLVTAHSDAFQENGGAVDSTAYFRDALAWIEERHGVDNVVAVNVQRDELAPHLVVYVVPLVEQAAKERRRSVIAGTNPDGSKRRETITVMTEAGVKLSAAHFIGSRDKLSALQTEFAAEVGNRHGLRRGIKGSKARHQTVKEWYAGHLQTKPPPLNLRPAALDPRVVKKGLIRDEVETRDQVAARVSGELQKVVAPYVATAGTAISERKKRQQAEATALSTVKKLEPLKPILDALEGLSDEDAAEAKAELVKFAHAKRIARARAAEVDQRVAAITAEARKGISSAVGRYCRFAWSALQRAGGDAGKLNWKEIDDNWAQTATQGRDEQGAASLSSEAIARAVQAYSPQYIGMTSAETKVGTATPPVSRRSTKARSYTAMERDAWRRRLVEDLYQTKIPDSLGVLLSFVDRNSLPNCLQLRLAGGGQLADLGDRIEASGHNLRAECRATVALCKVKGWTAVESDGPPEYVAMMRQEAERAGLQFGSPGLPAANPDSEPDDDEPRHGLR